MTETIKQSSTPNYLLRRERERRAWSQQDLADQVGTTPVNVSRWERGITSPSPYFRQKLCEVFEKNAQELGVATQTDGNLPAPHSLISGEASSTATLPAESPGAVWNVPYRRNPFFTGREEVLTHLHETLLAGQQPVALSQPQAISGLGGIGKTQTAIEYANRHREAYQAIFWARAESRDLLISDFLTIAALLHLLERNEQDQEKVVKAAIRWLDTHEGWLLILDNADDLDAASEFIPSAGKGHVLITTRAHSVGTIAQRIEIEKMSKEEGMFFLLRRVKRLKGTASLETLLESVRTQAQAIVEAVDGLPLALDQAGAYIEETGCSLSDYLKYYKTRQRRLLRTRGRDASGHPEPVATTWSLAFEKVEQANPAAAELLRLCAFLHPDEIPESMIIEGASELGPTLQSAAGDELDWNEAIRELRRYSLLKRDAEKKVLNIHRLVQAVIKDGMDEAAQREWAERLMRAMNKVFPDPDPDLETANSEETLQKLQSYLEHALICSKLINQWDLSFPEAAHLFNEIGTYLIRRGQYTEAEAILLCALSIDEQTHELNQKYWVNTYNNLATLYYLQGKYSEAESLYQRAIAHFERNGGAEHAFVAHSLNNLGLLYYEQGKQEQAEALFLRSLAIRQKIGGAEYTNVGESLNNLALLYEQQGLYTKAESLYLQSQEIVLETKGPEHPSLATNLDNLSCLYRKQGKYEQAEPLSRRALAIDEKVHGKEHPLVSFDLNNLGILCYLQGNYAEAEEYFQRALAIREERMGSGHFRVAQTLVNIGALYNAQGKYTEAERALLRARDIYEETLGSAHFHFAANLNELAKLYSNRRQYLEAEALFQQALTIQEQNFGLVHPDVATTLENYASLLHKTGREIDAAEMEARAQAIRAKQEKQE